MRTLIACIGILACLYAGTVRASGVLFDEAGARYDIVLCQSPSPSEQTAAAELAAMLEQVSGARFRVLRREEQGRPAVYVGYDETVGKSLGIARPADSDESFRWVTKNGRLYIFGGRTRGTMYGVYKFLEEQLGVRWYTTDFTKVPKRRAFTLPDLDERRQPAFGFRCLLYRDCQNNAAWSAHNALNSTMGGATGNAYGGIQGYAGVHTMTQMVTKEEFFSRHPEYFALREGKRDGDAQLCLSNANVIRLLTERTLKNIHDFPGNWCYSVSQADNDLYCECARCKKLEKKYGGHSGLLIWAVNQVAGEVARQYPEVYVGTLAYHYTQTAPKHIRPRDNVVVRLCDIDCCFGHDFTARENAPFLHDLEDWLRLTPNVYIWDYAVSFIHYMMPFPNFQAVAANLRLLQSHHAIGVMEEGPWDSGGTAFGALKQWCFAQLLWNPRQDVDSLAYAFIADYYGKAAGEVKEYYDLCNTLNAKHHLMFGTQAEGDYFDEAFVSDARRLLDTALRQAGNDSVTTRRVEAVRAQILYIETLRHPVRSRANGTARELRRFFERTQWNYREGRSYKELLSRLEYG